MRFLLCSLLVFCAHLLQAQTCNCTQTLDSVQQYMTKNYVAFGDKVNAGTQQAYLTHTANMRALSQKAITTPHCLYVINKWLSFFNDNHVYLHMPAVRVPNTDSFSFSKAELKSLQRPKPGSLEGIYYYGTDSTYQVAVIKNKKGLRSYAGVILASKASTWKPGQLKFELIGSSNGQYDMNLFNRNHEAIFSRLDEDWVKAGATPASKTTIAKPLFKEEDNLAVYFKQIDSTTGYIRVKSFDGIYVKQIDSVVYSNKTLIQRLPRLIIDVRNNGGGSDRCMKPLSEIIYTQPVTGIGNDIWATDDNILAFEKLVGKYRGQLSDSYLDAILKKLDKIRGLNGLVNFHDDNIDTLPEVWPQPQKVAILINKGCASTTEEFLVEALQSKKVTLVGSPSGGVLDYSNVVHKEFTCPSFELIYPTSRSRRIDQGKGIDNKGIKPQIPLDFTKAGWLNKLLARW